jgi:uroporphyrinogen-III decarboxylase
MDNSQSMTNKERILAALNLEKPDRVPTHTVSLDGNLVDEIFGKPKKNAFDVMQEMKSNDPENWTVSFNAMAGDLQASIFGKMMEGAAHLGFDASMTGYIPFHFESETTMTDIFGREYSIVNNEGNLFPLYDKGLIKNRADWEKWPEPNMKDILKRAKRVWKSVARRVKNKIMMFAADDYCSVFPPVWQGMGMAAFSKNLRKDPQLIQERFDMTTNFVIKLFRTYYEAGARVFFEGGDIAFKNGPLINPKYIDKYVLPAFQKVTEAVHSWGDTKIIFHSDGDITSLLDFIVESGFDALHCLEPTAYVDVKDVKKKVGHKLALLGNIDTMHVLTKNGTQTDVDSAVKRVISEAGENGGFILSPSNMHPSVSLQNLKWMINSTSKYGKYPPSF